MAMRPFIVSVRLFDSSAFSSTTVLAILKAKPNTSPVRRTGYTMRYFPSSVKLQDVPQNEGWKIWLARGRDLAGNDYANVPTAAR